MLWFLLVVKHQLSFSFIRAANEKVGNSELTEEHEEESSSPLIAPEVSLSTCRICGQFVGRTVVRDGIHSERPYLEWSFPLLS